MTWSKRLLSRGPVASIVRGLLGLILVLVAVETADASGWSDAALCLLVGYLILFVVVEILYHKSEAELSEDIERQANERVAAKREAMRAERGKVAIDLAMFDDAAEFIGERLQMTTEALFGLAASMRNSRDASVPQFNKCANIREAMKTLCHSYKQSVMQERNLLSTELWFKGTYMEIVPGEEVEHLEYIAWHTENHQPPRSLSSGHRTMKKGEGCAGKAWQENRVVVPNEFDLKHGWIPMWDGQTEEYTSKKVSMVCVPVSGGLKSGAVIGVITIDTNLSGFFGEDGDRRHTERVARKVHPYASYISFITAVDRLRMASEKAKADPA